MSAPKEPDAPISAAQKQTADAFGFKWAKRETYESPAVADRMRAWLFERYCEGDPEVLDGWLAGGRKTIVDAGCGAGHAGMLFFEHHLDAHLYVGVDVSSAVHVARRRFAEAGRAGRFVRCDLNHLPLADGTVDLILSEGVLHHTDDTEQALVNLSRALRPGGRFIFYVYRKKSVIREFVDDYLREALAGLDDEAAWEALMPLTRLGKALGDLDVEIEIPEDIPLLGIEAGRMQLQRFIYWHICKMFHRADHTIGELNHINFDWYRPSNCHRHTEEEVRGFCASAGLEIERLRVEPAGITVVARRA